MKVKSRCVNVRASVNILPKVLVDIILFISCSHSLWLSLLFVGEFLI